MTGRRTRLALLALTPLLFLGGGADDPKAPPFEPTDRYEARDVQGWTILVNKGLLTDQPELAFEALDLLGHQLDQVIRKVPPEAVKRLRSVRIWLEEREPHHPCMAYHPDPSWLRDHGMNPEKARCVEVANARNFLEWIKVQPWMVFHELAHAYHHQALEGGFGNGDVRDAFRSASREKRYESVLYADGREKRAYAATNRMEYFAESSEAFFGSNDFYPFVRAELKQHDPEMEALLAKLWKVGSKARVDGASKRAEMNPVTGPGR